MKVILLKLSEKGLGRARPHVVLWATTAIPETLIVVEQPQRPLARTHWPLLAGAEAPPAHLRDRLQ